MKTFNIKLVAYYIYAYVNTNKPGFYQYKTSFGDIEFNYEPIYIGKGTGDRISSHTDCTYNSRLKDYIDSGNFKYFKIQDELSSHKAYKLEVELIYTIGRLDLNKGPLVNESAGIHLVETSSNLDISPYHLEYNKMIHTLKIMNQTSSLIEASKILGISERTLYRYNKAYKIERISKGNWVQILR